MPQTFGRLFPKATRNDYSNAFAGARFPTPTSMKPVKRLHIGSPRHGSFRRALTMRAASVRRLSSVYVAIGCNTQRNMQRETSGAEFRHMDATLSANQCGAMLRNIIAIAVTRTAASGGGSSRLGYEQR